MRSARIIFVILISFFLVSSLQSCPIQSVASSSVISSSSVYAPLPVDWTNGMGYGCSMKQTADKGYIIAGGEDARPEGCWLAKIDESGNSMWRETYVQSGFECAGRAVQQTVDGGYVLAGLARSNSLSRLKAWLVKTDEFGKMEWNKSYAGKGDAVAFSGQQTSDGGYVLAGWSAPADVNNEDFYLVKTDSGGNVEWDRYYGGSSNDIAWFVQQTFDGGYILAGQTYSFGAGYTDCLLVKTDSNGEMEWNKTYGNGWFDAALCVRQTTDGGYVFAGYQNWDGGQRISGGSAWVVKTDSQGEIEWNDYFYGTPIDASARAYSVKETNDGGYIVAGYATFEGQTGMVLLKTHSKGSGFDWKGTYMGYWGFDVIQTIDGGYAVAGSGLIKTLPERPLIARFQYSPNNPIIQEDIMFNATYSYDRNQDIASYSWDFDDGNISSTTNPIVSHRYDHSGTYNVSLTVEDAEGLNSTYSGQVNIPAGPPVASFEYSPSTPVFQESIIFNASNSYDLNHDIVSYLWNFDDGNITSVMSPIVIHRYENAGIYNVSLRVVDAEGFNSSYSVVVCAKNPTSLSISTSSPSGAAGYSVSITVTLLDSANVRLKNEIVDLFCTFTGVENWTPICSNCTDSLGNYYAKWSPPAASYFTIKAVYAGNYTHVESSRKVTISMLPYGETYLFSVESNSTVSSMGFDTNNQTLSFTTTGEMGTVGYAKVTAAKSLVPNLALLSVNVDGAEYNYSVTDTDDSWVLLFAYDHSVHLVEIQLDSTIPEFMPSTLLMLLMTATLLAAMVYRKASKKTSASRVR